MQGRARQRNAMQVMSMQGSEGTARKVKAKDASKGKSRKNRQRQGDEIAMQGHRRDRARQSKGNASNARQCKHRKCTECDQNTYNINCLAKRRHTLELAKKYVMKSDSGVS